MGVKVVPSEMVAGLNAGKGRGADVRRFGDRNGISTWRGLSPVRNSRKTEHGKR
jgi:hypothetical protein